VNEETKELIERIIQFYKEGRNEQDIRNVDYEIDEEIYNLHGITEEKKKVIEECFKIIFTPSKLYKSDNPCRSRNYFGTYSTYF
jgi:hypothetical protein